MFVTLMHVGNQRWARTLDPVWSDKQEHQARGFAAWLTMPESEDPWAGLMSAGGLAQRYRVVEELAVMRVERIGAQP